MRVGDHDDESSPQRSIMTFSATLIGDKVEPETGVYRGQRQVRTESGYLTQERGNNSMEDNIFDQIHDVD